MDAELPPPPSRIRVAAATAATLAVAAAGAALFTLASAPAAYLTGSAVAVLIAVAAGMPTALPDPLRNGTFAILGMMLGAGVSLAALEALVAAPLAFAGLAIVVVGATVVGFLVLRRLGGWDPVTALCGSIPGNFSIVLVVALENGARMEQVVMAQALRLFILVVLVPFAIAGPEASQLRTTAPADFSAPDVVATLVVAFAAALIGKPLGLPAPTFLGPLIAAVALSASGLVTVAVPDLLAAATFVVLGAAIAERFRGVPRAGLARTAMASLAAFLAALAVAVATTAAFSALTGAPFGALFLAYAPGGLDAMMALSFLLHYDVAFVAVAHTARMIALGVSVPLLVARLAARRSRARA